MDEFIRSYMETAIWSSTDNDGIPLDDSKYANVEWSSEALKQIETDCQSFQEQIKSIPVLRSESGIAHDFWLTRNHHGAGFWDGDYPKEVGERLTQIAHSFGESNIYIGDDGKFYLA